MHVERTPAADSTAARVALWRALHVQVDPPPHVLEDEIGLQAGGPGRRLAPPSGHGPAGARAFSAPPLWHALVSSRIWSWKGWPRRRPVRHPRSGPGHFRPAQAGDRLRPARIRGRPAWPSSLEATAPDRPRLRHPGVAAVRAGRLRGGRRLVERLGLPASMPASPRSWPPLASACTSPRTRSRPRCARSRRSLRDPHCHDVPAATRTRGA